MNDFFDTLADAAATQGTPAMLAMLAESLTTRRRWHALFDLRLLEARAALGLPTTGDVGTLDEATREKLDEKSLAACREVGWPLLDEGQVAAGWMYLRAAAEPSEVSHRLAALARVMPDDDEIAAGRLQDIVQIALWEGVDPALGIRLVIESQGTCNSITAYEQAVARLPAVRQRDAAAVLVEHLHHEVAASLAADLGRRGIVPADRGDAAESIVALLDAAGGLTNDPSIHVDVSHLQSVLRIGRVCIDRPILEKAWELAVYACRLPEEVNYPGESPFENVAEASRLFFGALMGREIDRSLAFFQRAATAARLEEAGTLPADTLVYMLWKLGRNAEALRAALSRPTDHGMPSIMQASGMLPSLVELAVAGDALDSLREACRERGDEITFAASYL
ncbi:MAG: hypothetical protein ACKOEX_07295 [Planctomycetia bacterium]